MIFTLLSTQSASGTWKEKVMNIGNLLIIMVIYLIGIRQFVSVCSVRIVYFFDTEFRHISEQDLSLENICFLYFLFPK